jgi:hypothetical protein
MSLSPSDLQSQVRLAVNHMSRNVITKSLQGATYRCNTFIGAVLSNTSVLKCMHIAWAASAYRNLLPETNVFHIGDRLEHRVMYLGGIDTGAGLSNARL